MSEKRLLVIDDELGFREFVSNVATAAGYEVEAAGHADFFKEIYPRFKPTLIMMDMILPDVDGFELMQWLIEQGCTARVIVVTGYNPHYAEMAESIGSDSVMLGVESMTKPVGLVDLRAALAS